MIELGSVINEWLDPIGVVVGLVLATPCSGPGTTWSAGRIQALAELYGLSTYDAPYLELAQRRSAGLASFDEQLNRAAQASGVPVLGAA